MARINRAVCSLGIAGNEPPSIKEVRRIYLFKKNPLETAGLFYLESKPRTIKVVTEVPSCNKGGKGSGSLWERTGAHY